MSELGKAATPASQPVEREERQEPTVARCPDYKVQYGRVQAAVWRRDLDGRASYSVSLTRSYRDKDDQWQRTTNLDEEDLLPAAKALDDAYTWIPIANGVARQRVRLG